MRVVVFGASGFIGRHAAAALRSAGHEVLASRLHIHEGLTPSDWLAAVAGADAVVNAVGILRESRDRSFTLLHDVAPRSLFRACEQAGVWRVVQVSALGADEHASSRFHLSKRSADRFLAGTDLAWSIVQPSLVFGDGGQSARLFMLLAALPLTPLPGDGRQRVQPIHVEDLAELIARLVVNPSRSAVPGVGPREVELREWLGILRAQMGLSDARFLEIPRALLPLDRDTLEMLDRGNTASPEAITRVLGRSPRAPEAFVAAKEARGVRTQARLDWLLPLLSASLALVWIGSGAVSLGLYPMEESLALLARIGLAHPFIVYGAALLDIAIGVAILAVRRGKWLWRLQIALVAGYTLIIAIWLPELWLHPFGPVLKNLPMLAAIVALHELEEG